jgi:hypothetical protein
MTLDDVDHYSDEEKKRIAESYPEHEREARTRGIPTLGSGRIFPVSEASITVDHRTIPLIGRESAAWISDGLIILLPRS